jgi:hypothetical protein
VILVSSCQLSALSLKGWLAIFLYLSGNSFIFRCAPQAISGLPIALFLYYNTLLNRELKTKGGAHMPEDLSGIPLLARREIEARIAVPLIQAYMEAFDADKAQAVAAGVIERMAEESGRQLARKLGDDGLPGFSKALSMWNQGGALEMETLEQSDTRLWFNVTRCRYAETYRELGMGGFGTILSCNRDFAFIKGFNPNIRLTRTKTIMEGANICDFRYEI